MTTRTLEQWQTILEEQQACGLSVVPFCQQNNINVKTFYNRRAKLGINAERAAPAFIKAKPVKIQSPQILTLTLGEAKVDIPGGASPQWLAELLKAVTS